MNCPVCKTVALVMSERVGVEIDYCPDCRGVWLDRGELDKIIEKQSLSQPAAENTGLYGERRSEMSGRHGNHRGSSHSDSRYRDDDRYYGKKKRKGSFLGDLFDF
ncbi:MAG: zf-TFIIB domain-containing protein [Francisellaceae bacterium]